MMPWLILFAVTALAGGISGTVADENGLPVSGVLLFCYDLRLGYTYASTDDNGNYEFDSLSAGAYRLRAVPGDETDFVEQYWPDSADYCDGELLTLPDSSTWLDADFRLAGGALLSGTVLDSDGEPVPNARIEAEGVGIGVEGYSREAWTDQDGHFQLRGLRTPEYGSGPYVLEAEAEGWPAQYLGGSYDQDTAHQISVPASADVGDWILNDGVLVTGTVYGPDAPEEGATVHVYSEGQVLSVETDQSGAYEAWALPPGSVLAWATADGLGTTYYPDADRPGEYLDSGGEGSVLQGVDLHMPWEATFSGRLEGTGDLSGATALLYNDTFTVGWGAALDPDGLFEMDALHGGSYALFIFAADEGYVDDFVLDDDGETRWFQVDEGQATRAWVSLPRGASIQGWVTDDQGEPVYGAYVYAEETSGEGAMELASTADDGSYLLNGLHEGVYEVQVRYNYYCPLDPGYVTVYWDGAVNELQASSLPLLAGEFRSDMNFVMPVDMDHDGMSDTWEADYGLDTTRDDSSEDPDGDGYTNIEEYLLGTNPTQNLVQDTGCGCNAPVTGDLPPWFPLPILLLLFRRNAALANPLSRPWS